MDLLRKRILEEGKYLGNGILKVDGFMNHQIDPMLMQSIGAEFARRFKHLNPSRILTAETSGIAPALATGMMLKIPVVFARKHQPKTMAAQPLRQMAESYTKGGHVELIVSSEYLSANDRILILDDFLATAKTILALVKLVQMSKAELVGIGTVIEKSFERGRKLLTELHVPIETLVAIERFEGERIIFA